MAAQRQRVCRMAWISFYVFRCNLTFRIGTRRRKKGLWENCWHLPLVLLVWCELSSVTKSRVALCFARKVVHRWKWTAAQHSKTFSNFKKSQIIHCLWTLRPIEKMSAKRTWTLLSDSWMCVLCAACPQDKQTHLSGGNISRMRVSEKQQLSGSWEG